jgi:hypothetical protein
MPTFARIRLKKVPSKASLLRIRASSYPAATAFAAAVGLATLAPATASAQIVIPPAEFVATTEPVYYGGHASYWYNGHWYWKDEHGGWQHYESEPRELADHRAHSPPPTKHYYGKPAPRPGPPWPEPHGGGRR